MAHGSNAEASQLTQQETALKRKTDGDHIEGSPAKRIKTSSTPDPAPRVQPLRIVPFPEKVNSQPETMQFPWIANDFQPAVLEERGGDIEFRVVNNDGSPESFMILTGLKCIFQKQLPKMPKDYIARLVYDRTHLSMAIVKNPLEVVG